MLYLSIILVLFFLIFHYDYQRHNRGRKVWFIALGIVFALIAGLRYRLGIDTIVYDQMYREFPSLGNYLEFDFESIRYGRGFLLFVACCKSISSSFVFFQLIHAAFVNATVFYFLYKYSVNIFFAVLLYFLISYFPYNYEVLRESCAVCMLLIGWKYFLESKWLKYYIIFIIAYLFHPSGIIIGILPLFYLPIFRPFFKMGILQLIFSIVMFMGAISLNFFELIRLVDVKTLQDYASLYEASDYANSLNLNFFGILDYLIRYIIYPIGALWLIKVFNPNANNQTENSKYEKFQYMLFWYVYIAILAFVLRIFYRFNNYFAPFVIIIISNAAFSVLKFPKKSYKLSFGIWLCLLFPYFVFTLSPYFRSDGFSKEMFLHRYYPYESVITMEKDKAREQLYKSNGR